MKRPRPEALDPGVQAAYLAERAALKLIMPRARVVQDVDGTLIVTARAARHAPNHLYVQAPRRFVGMFYSGSPRVYLFRAAGLVERHLAGDGEGILHLRWCPELAKALPWFSRPTRRGIGKPLRPRHGDAKPALSPVSGAEVPGDGSPSTPEAA